MRRGTTLTGVKKFEVLATSIAGSFTNVPAGAYIYFAGGYAEHYNFTASVTHTSGVLENFAGTYGSGGSHWRVGRILVTQFEATFTVGGTVQPSALLVVNPNGHAWNGGLYGSVSKTITLPEEGAVAGRGRGVWETNNGNTRTGPNIRQALPYGPGNYTMSITNSSGTNNRTGLGVVGVW